MKSERPPDSNSPASGENDPLAEARDLIERLLEERITAEQAARFEMLVRENREVRRLYLQTMNMVSNLPHYLSPHEWVLGGDSVHTTDGFGSSLEESMELPALDDGDWADEEPPAMRVPDIPKPIPPSQTPVWIRRGGAAAAILIAIGIAAWILSPRKVPSVVATNPPTAQPTKPSHEPPPPVVAEPPIVESPKLARLTATAGVKWSTDSAIEPGSVLDFGRNISFSSGAVEVVFATGTRLVVEGPAAFRVMDPNHARLEYGKLVARVPPPGRGFGVQFGERTITDLGTEFGLEGTAQQSATVSVFEGQVVLDKSPSAEFNSTTKPTTEASGPMHLTQGDVVATADAQQDWKPAEPASVRFARTLADVRLAIPVLPTTGIGMKDGQRDPNWFLYQESVGEASIKPAAVTTTGPPSPTFWVGNDPTRSQWLSTDGGLPGVWPGTWIFRTTIDLSGFDPATANVQADVMVDDGISDVLINHVSTGLSLPMSSDRLNWRQFHRLTLKGFKAGKNTIDFVVRNGDPYPGQKTSKMGLRVEFHGDAVPLVVR